MIHQLPPVFVIEPTNRCNMRCVMCPQNRQKEQGDISIDLINILTLQIRHSAKYIQLYLLGEPTLHPKILTIVNHLKQYTDATLEISTNLTAYDSVAEWENFLCSGIDRVYCCIEGTSIDSYKALRTTGDFDKARSAVRTMSEIKMDNQLNVDLVVKNIGTTFNEGEQEEFDTYWNAVPGIRTVTSWMNTWAGSIPSLEKIGLLRPPNIDNEREACAELWNKMVIRWNGEVVLCCHDWKPDIVLGDSYTRPLQNIWNDDTISNIRQQHIKKSFPGICSPCKEWSLAEEYTTDYGLPFAHLIMPR
jgi:radical SAM protein with 4Fe4S-binding SPASM domain